MVWTRDALNLFLTKNQGEPVPDWLVISICQTISHVSYWYRFSDQPALLNAGLTEEEREQPQKRVEKIHRCWPEDHDYLAPPTVGTLIELDPAQLVTPPRGKEAGYVPIATRQECGGWVKQPSGH